MTLEVLIVDDETDILRMASGILRDEGYSCRVAGDSDTAVAALDAGYPDLVILDIWLENSALDGMDLLRRIQDERPGMAVVMMSGHGTIEMAVEAIKLGAHDFIEKPFKADRLIVTASLALEAAQLRRDYRELRERTGAADELVGTSRVVVQLDGMLARVAPTDSRVLISGPPGVGKEVFARQLHQRSARSNNAFVTINCAAMAPDRMEAELFGEEGAGSSAPALRGALETAHRGTLLLDEVCDMPLETQGKFVRVLHDRAFVRTGSEKPIEVDVRVIASTSRDIEHQLASGQFREDLYYRLNVVPVRIPPLRERRDDIPALVEYFITGSARTAGLTPRRISDEAMARLQTYDWPGNVRQLRNAVDWILIMAPGGADDMVKVENLPPDVLENLPVADDAEEETRMFSLPLRAARAAFERRYLQTQVSRFGGNVSETARFVGMERTALYRKLKLLGIDGRDASDPADHRGANGRPGT